MHRGGRSAFEDFWAVKLRLEPLRDLLKSILRSNLPRLEDAEGWIELAELAKRITGIDFQGIYELITSKTGTRAWLVRRGMFRSRFQVEKEGPGAGAELLAQRIQIAEEFPGGIAPGVRRPN